MDNKRLLGNGMLLFAALIWGTSFAFQREGMDSVEPVTFTAARMFLASAAVALAAFFNARKNRGARPQRTSEEEKVFGRNTVMGGLCCGFFLTIASLLQQTGLVYTTAGKAGFITALYMLLVPVFGYIFLRKKCALIVLFAVLLGVAGMYLLCITDGFRLQTGDLLVCLCAVFYAGHILCVDRFAPLGDPFAMSALQFAVAAAVSAAGAFALEEPSMEKLVSAAVPIIYSGVMSGGVAFTLQMVAQKHTEPATASLLMSMEAVFAVIAGAVMLHEHMTARELCGCAVMFAAVVLVQIPAPSSSRRKAP